jgi:hypothetical protein
LSKFTEITSESPAAIVDAIVPLLRVALVAMKYIRSEFSSNWCDGFRRCDFESGGDQLARDLVDLDGRTELEGIDRISFLSQYRLSIILAVSTLVALHFDGLRFPSKLADSACFNILIALSKMFDIAAPDEGLMRDQAWRGDTIRKFLEIAIQTSGKSGTEWCYINAPVKSLVALMNSIDLAARVLITIHDRSATSSSSGFDSSLTEYAFDALSSVAATARLLASPAPPIEDDATTDSEGEESTNDSTDNAPADRLSSLLSKYILEQLTGIEVGSSKQKGSKAVIKSSIEVLDNDEHLDDDGEDEIVGDGLGSSSDSVAEPSEIDSDESSDTGSFDSGDDGVKSACDEEVDGDEPQGELDVAENQPQLGKRKEVFYETVTSKRSRK